MVLDPLSALSLAGNVFQLIDFSSKIVSKGQELYKSSDGALDENRHYEVIAASLAALSARLQTGAPMQNAGNNTHNLGDQGFENIRISCLSISQKLLSHLEKLKVEGKHDRWKSMRQALKSVWNKAEIDEIARRLTGLRSELELHILVSLR